MFKGGNLPDEEGAGKDKWENWINGTIGEANVRGGAPLGNEGKVLPTADVVKDIPVEKSAMSGYIIVEADDLDAAAEMAKGCPVFLGGGSVEVRPHLPGMEA